MSNQIPLAERMRPRTLEQFVGQKHLVGKGRVLRQMLEQGKVQSMILWGPPGVGKTTLAQLVASVVGMNCYTLSAIDSGVKEVRAVIERARSDGHAVLFIDEIHRFNKAQQDSLLGAVERGIITLIGATTENPSFEVISALLSRCQVYILEALSAEELKEIVFQALQQDTLLQDRKIEIFEWDALLRLSGGDARKLLNLLELTTDALQKDKHIIDNAFVQETVQQKMALYDKSGEQHYDIISAFIKSMRGSDPNGAIYWLARMIEGGEEPRFIARRMVIFASEDIGNANPNALLLATSAFQAVELIGYPECRIILAQAATYLASSVKSNASYLSIGNAQSLVRQTGDLPVPLHLRNAPTQLMKNLNYGKEYCYPHDFPGNFIAQEYLPDALSGKKLYQPGNSAAEQRLSDYLRHCWKEKYGY